MPLVDRGEFLAFVVASQAVLKLTCGSHTLIPPRGYSIAGIYGTCGQWVDGLGLIITR